MRRGKGRNGLLPSSLRIISSCLKTVSSNAGTVASTVRSGAASVAASIAVPAEAEKDQVLWVGFDKLDLSSASFKHVLLLGYSNGFQVVDVEDASNVCELVSKRDGPVTFLQMLPLPAKSEGSEGFRASHPLLLVVAGDESNGSGTVQGGRLSAFIKESGSEPQQGNCISTPTVVRFYSLKSHSYVHVLRFRSAVYIVRCSPRIIAVALAAQIYCFDPVTLENKFSVLTYPLQGSVGSSIGYGPMSVGPRWLAYSPNNPLLSNTGRLSPQNLTPSPGVSPSTSPGNGSLVARYAMESSKQLATGIFNLGDMGYKTLSKYCHEFLPDGSNSPLSNSGRRMGRHPSLSHHSEADNAGMVVVKDFISKDTISQFRAHTSPISALCFDPSGTLLVTASVHGNNINVFRIMPACVPNGSNSGRYDWTASHVHLYKLYRGLTTAVIQDISFSHYSQWVSIVSSRGTCHIFMLSPFGGDVSLQPQSIHTDGPPLVPNISLPWWSTPCMMDQQFLPPAPVTLSVVSRIKNGNSGWLNTVSNVAASAAVKLAIPSGAMAAVFHNCIYNSTLPLHPKASSLEHLLVYSPSGHMIQHELVPSSCVESSDSSSRTGSGPLLPPQDEELHVNAESVQWWDVCRKSSWPEREENISKIYDNQQNAETVMDTSDCEDNDTIYPISSVNSISGKEFVKSHERHNWYLSNAEVLINSGRLPIWQKSKICFYVMSTPNADGKPANNFPDREVEIEKVPVHEVEIRRKDLLPVFEQVRSCQADWTNRSNSVGTHQSLKVENNTFTRNPVSLASGSNVGPSVDSVPVKCGQNSNDIMQSEIENGSIGSMLSLSQKNRSARMRTTYSEKDRVSFHSGPSNSNSPMDDSVINSPSSFSMNNFSYTGRSVVTNTHSVNNGVSSEVSSASSHSILAEQTGNTDSHNSAEFTQYFQEGYCKVSELDDCRDLAEAVTDADSSSSHCEREKTEDDVDNDDMLGGVFSFSEEG